jgi:glycosyltransferase involved in cell wall biosynthesis
MIPERISVIIPAFNAAGMISRAIASAFAQTHPPNEIVVADDGSTDGTAKEAREAGATVLELRKANGSVARNRAVDTASGEMLFFLDADDWWEQTKIETHLGVWRERNPSFVVDVAQKMIGDEERGLLGAGPEGDVAWEEYLLWTTWTSGSSFSVPRERYLSLGGFSEDLISQQDVDFWVRCAHAHGPAYRIAHPHTYYRLSPGGVSKKPRDVEGNLQRVLAKWPFASEKQKSEFRMQMILTAAGFSRFPSSLQYFKMAGWPIHRMKMWRALGRSIVGSRSR